MRFNLARNIPRERILSRISGCLFVFLFLFLFFFRLMCDERGGGEGLHEEFWSYTNSSLDLPIFYIKEPEGFFFGRGSCFFSPSLFSIVYFLF